MQKIPTLFRRDPENMSRVTDEVNPECQWVIDGEGTPTRKIDGTCVMLDEDGNWWARREVKPSKTPPPNFVAISTDPNTGKTMGWEPVEQSAFAKFWQQAYLEYGDSGASFTPGTYELCGPKVNGNPEGYEYHTLVKHDPALLAYEAGTPEELIEVARVHGWEGVVWHHPDGRMAKLKVRDFA